MTRQSANAKVRQTGKAAKITKLEELLGFQLPTGTYIPEHAMDAWFASLAGENALGTKEEVAPETDEEIDARLRERFDALHQLTDLAIEGEVRSLIVSGPPGLGKSFDIEKKLRTYDPSNERYTIVKGFATGTGFFKQLWDHRHEGSILVMDDSDSIWYDDKALALLKSATDTSDERILTYLSEGTLLSDKDKSRVPNRFEFKGTLIFITNMDLDQMSQRDNRIGPHMEALMSRGQYVDLTMRNRRDYIVRIRQVVEAGLLNQILEKKAAQKEVMDFIEESAHTLRTLDLRMVIKVANLRRLKPQAWKSLAKITCFRAA